MITNRMGFEYREFPDEVFCKAPTGARRCCRLASSRDSAAFPKRPLTCRIASVPAPSSPWQPSTGSRLTTRTNHGMHSFPAGLIGTAAQAFRGSLPGVRVRRGASGGIAPIRGGTTLPLQVPESRWADLFNFNNLGCAYEAVASRGPSCERTFRKQRLGKFAPIGCGFTDWTLCAESPRCLSSCSMPAFPT